MTFNDDEIRKHVRQTAGKRKNLDYDRLKFMENLKKLALRRDEEAYETCLIEADIQRGSKQWRELKSAFQAFQQLR